MLQKLTLLRGFLRIKPCAGSNFKIFLNSFFVKENQKLCPCMILSGGNLRQILIVILYITACRLIIQISGKVQINIAVYKPYFSVRKDFCAAELY